MTDLRFKWEDDKNGQPIYIPYEINHDFFLHIQLNLWKLNSNLQGISIAWPDYWSGFEIEGEDLDTLINDWRNWWELLPNKWENYYSEWTVDTPGLSHRWQRRIIIWWNGEEYYTDDHYWTFIKIK
jgi:hypothetical protein